MLLVDRLVEEQINMAVCHGAFDDLPSGRNFRAFHLSQGS